MGGWYHYLGEHRAGKERKGRPEEAATRELGERLHNNLDLSRHHALAQIWL